MSTSVKSLIKWETEWTLADASNIDPCPTDPWLFTDPQAYQIYEQRDQLESLKEDILLYVMDDGRWTSDELECMVEIRRLMGEGVLAAKTAFGDLSPHATVYSALDEGELNIAGVRYPFEIGEEIIFEPWLNRLAHPGLNGPVRIGWVYTVTGNLCLCCDAFPQVCIQCQKTRATLRQILAYRKKRS